MEDTGTLSRLLGDLVVYRGAGDSYRDYAGQGVKYTLTLADGTVTEVTAFNPFLIIDGTAYKTKYAPVVVASCISFASSSQAAYPSLPAKAESSVIPLLLLSQ